MLRPQLSPFSVNKLKSLLLMIVTMISISPAATYAQDQDKDSLNELKLRPIFVTTRIFQLRARSGGGAEATDQIFRMRTASLHDHDKWISVLRKTYPGFEIAMIRTDLRRVYRTSRPTIMPMGKSADGRSLDLAMNGAQSPGDGVTPGTTLVPEISISFGARGKPVHYSSPFIEIESGMTYFYAMTSLKLNADDYAKFFRATTPPDSFKGDDFLLVLAHSTDIDKTDQPERYMDERQSAQLQNSATKKVQPEIPANIRETNLSGFIRVRVDVSPEGKVTAANIQYSSFPEINNEAMAAARRWEFPASLFAEDKRPITGFLTFSVKGDAEK